MRNVRPMEKFLCLFLNTLNNFFDFSFSATCITKSLFGFDLIFLYFYTKLFTSWQSLIKCFLKSFGIAFLAIKLLFVLSHFQVISQKYPEELTDEVNYGPRASNANIELRRRLNFHQIQKQETYNYYYYSNGWLKRVPYLNICMCTYLALPVSVYIFSLICAPSSK